MLQQLGPPEALSIYATKDVCVCKLASAGATCTDIGDSGTYWFETGHLQCYLNESWVNCASWPHGVPADWSQPVASGTQRHELAQCRAHALVRTHT
eukprot:213968-Amphidinium_carterae.1